MFAFTYIINKIEFERLPKPYDTDCQEYGTSNRFQCLNQCIKHIYHDRFGCIPQYHSLYTYILDDNIKYLNFCHDIYLNNITLMNLDFELFCKKQCRTPCNEFSYEVDIMKFEFYYYEMYLPSFYIGLAHNGFTKIIYSPSLEFGNLIINLTNIWSLWHGMSFIKIVIEFFVALKRISFKLNIRCSIHLINIMKIFQKSNFHKSSKVIHYMNFNFTFFPKLTKGRL